jgi:hypothetical protein
MSLTTLFRSPRSAPVGASRSQKSSISLCNRTNGCSPGGNDGSPSAGHEDPVMIMMMVVVVVVAVNHAIIIIILNLISTIMPD